MKKLTRSYIIALSLIAVFTITSQIIIQNFLGHQKNEATLINIAGRQRMLSQKITKQVFILIHAQSLQTFEEEQQQLSEIYRLWTNSHQGLLTGNEALNLPNRKNSDSIQILFEAIEPHYQALERATQGILNVSFEEKTKIETTFLKIITENEAPFLKLMNTIVAQYELEANQKLKRLQRIEMVLMAITLFILVLEAVLIFRPIILKTTKHVSEINTKNEELITQEEELKQNLEELTSIQESLRHNQQKLKITLAENLSINHALDNSAIISITDLKGNILKVNTIFCETSGFQEEELLGNNQNIVNSGFHSKDFWKEMWATVGNGNTWRGEIKNKSKEGQEYWVDAVINPMYDETGKIYRYLSIRYLVTERKQAEQELIKINEDINASIKYAKGIQEAILPTVTEITSYLPNSFVFYKPRDIVSGDFYFFAKKGYSTVVAAVDCTGHGIPGAFMSLIGNHLLNEIINVEGITEPNKILNVLRQKIIKVLRQRENDNKDGMDIAICTIHQIPEEMEELMGRPYLEYAGAGNPLLYFQEEQVQTIKGDLIIIGGFRNYVKEESFKKHTISLEKPTTFYIYSDGIQDQFGGESRRRFSKKRLKNLLQDIHQKPMQEQKQILAQNIQQWQDQGGERQIDDMLLIGFHLP